MRPSLVKDLIIGWNRVPIRRDEGKVWRTVPSICSGQSGRNRLVFENEEFSLNRLKRAFVFSLCS